MNSSIKISVTAKPASFNQTQMATLNVLIDLLIPASRDARMPSAKSLSLYKDINDLPPKDRLLFEDGLADIELRSMKLYDKAYSQLLVDDAKALVEILRSEGSPFIQSFMTQTVGRYLAHDEVVVLIGLEARPLWPKGNTVAEGDWTLLDVVRNRPKLYREV